MLRRERYAENRPLRNSRSGHSRRCATSRFLRVRSRRGRAAAISGTRNGAAGRPRLSFASSHSSREKRKDSVDGDWRLVYPRQRRELLPFRRARRNISAFRIKDRSRWGEGGRGIAGACTRTLTARSGTYAGACARARARLIPRY